MPNYLEDEIAATEARLAQLREDAARREATQAEQRAQNALSGTVQANRDHEQDRYNERFAQTFNDAPRDAYGQRMGISPAAVQQYTNNRFVQHVRREMMFWHELKNRPYDQIIPGGSQ